MNDASPLSCPMPGKGPMGGRRAAPLARAALALCLVAAASPSCRLLQERAHPAVLEARAESPSAAVTANARFVRPDDKVPGFFKTSLADSGYAAVQVVLRNAGGDELWIHSANGMELGPGFAGIRLVCGADTLEPAHPAEVASALMGAKKAQRFRKPGALGFAMSPMLPPLGVFTIYEEVVSGRFYRPLFGKSLYPALQSGLFEPIRLPPGEERRGWLYFAVAPSRRDTAWALLVTACVPPAAPRSKLAGYDFLFSRPSLARGGSLAGSPGAVATSGEEYLYALAKEKKTSVLSRWSVSDLEGDPVPAPARIETFATKTADLVDAEQGDARGAVAVNFKSKSRAIGVAGGQEPRVAVERSFPRALRRVAVLGDRIAAITENGFAFVVGAGSRPAGNGTSLARGFDDGVFIGDTLFAFSNERGLDLHAAVAGSAELAFAARYAARRGGRVVAGASEDAIVVLHRGKRIVPDTLVYFHPTARNEMRRGALPGRVRRLSCGEAGVVLQLEDGTVLRISAGPRGSFRIDEAGYLPFAAIALKALPGRFIAVGPDGLLVAGRVGAFRPGRGGAYETAVPVE